MALTRLTKDMDIIQKLGDEPNDVDGLSSAELKAKFDEGNNAMKQWVNDTFIPEVENEIKASRLENLPEHAHTHAKDGRDPITPADIGFDHSAQEIDDAVDKANNAVNKAGDTMVGDLSISKGMPAFNMNVPGSSAAASVMKNATADVDYSTVIKDVGLDGATAELIIAAKNGLDNSLLLGKGGIAYSVLHTGSKPSGTYTGNGSATARQMMVGGIGSNCVCYCAGYITFIFGGYAYSISSNGVTLFNGISCYYGGGILTISTTDPALNANGVTYYYRVF